MSDPKLTEAQREALYDALHADIDGDFLVGADGYGEDIAMQHAGAGDVVRWAVNAVAPVVARMVAEAEQTAADLRTRLRRVRAACDISDASHDFGTVSIADIRDALDGAESRGYTTVDHGLETAVEELRDVLDAES